MDPYIEIKKTKFDEETEAAVTDLIKICYKHVSASSQNTAREVSADLLTYLDNLSVKELRVVYQLLDHFVGLFSMMEIATKHALYHNDPRYNAGSN
jgi:hypothetical protein